MRTMLADKILEMLSLDKTSENYQRLYRIEDLILKDSTDYFVLETAIERKLVEVPKCDVCGRKKERSYSSNGVLDIESCPKEDLSGKHK